MRRIWVWFLLSCKRYLRRPSFLLMLLLLPAMCFFLRSRETGEDQQIRVAVCAVTEDGSLSGGSSHSEGRSHSGGSSLSGGSGLSEGSSHSGGSEADLGVALADRLANGQSEGSLFHFYLCENETAVQEEVASRRAECGYVIAAGLRERIAEGHPERTIRVYRAPSTVADKLADEVVFAALASLYDREIFVDYVAESGIMPGGGGAADVAGAGDTADMSGQGNAADMPGGGNGVDTSGTGNAADMSGMGGAAEVAAIGEAYDRWFSGGATFRFEYHYLDRSSDGGRSSNGGSSSDGDRSSDAGQSSGGGQSSGEAGRASSVQEASVHGNPSQGSSRSRLFPVRGLAAVVLFLAGVYSAMILGLDEKKGLFLRLLAGERIGCKIASAMAPTALTALSCLAALWAGGCVSSWGWELAMMILYVPAVTLYGLLLGRILRRPQLVGCLIPFLLVAALISCPVFLDAGRYVPALRTLGRFFPPWYYLKAF